MPSTIFIVLAKSKKHKKFCVAGKTYISGNIGEWVRPVNPKNDDSDALTHTDIEYSDKRHPGLLDITSFTYFNKAQHPIQRENLAIDPGFYWGKIGVFKNNELKKLLDTPPTLWHINNSSYNGKNDRFLTSLIKAPIQSLYFINVKNLSIRVKREGSDFGNDLKRFRGLFTYNSIDYGLIITDPQIYSDFGQLKEDTYDVGECFLTLSTAPHSDGYCYKFIAAIIK